MLTINGIDAYYGKVQAPVSYTHLEEKALQLIASHIFSIQKRLLDIWDRREVEDLK